MRRQTQFWLTGTVVVAIGVVSAVVLNQRAEISLQEQAMDAQSMQSSELKDRAAQAEQLRQQEATFALQLRAMDATQAGQAAEASANRAGQLASDQRALDRQRLEGQIQNLRSQQVKLAHQNECSQTQSRMRLAESTGDSGQLKALQDRWDASCASG